jgi:MraZ protein
MFIGEFSHNLDDKNRLMIPVKFRASLAGGLVITRGLDGCLWLYPKSEFESLAIEISKLPITQINSRNFSRLMLSGAMDLEMDKIGRVVIPGYLKDYSAISDRVVMAGVYNRIEIWPAEKWQSFKGEMESNSSEIAENLADIGF